MNIEYKFVIVTIGAIAFDIFTGVIGSCIRGEFKSSEMRKGGMRKLFLLVVVAFGVGLDVSQQLVDLGFSIPANTMICSYISLMECLSILENINLTYPDALPTALTNILYNTAKENGIKENEKD